MPQTYLQRRGKSDPEQERLELASYEAGQAWLQYQSDFLETKRGLQDAKKELEDAKSEYPYNTKKIMTCADKVEGLERGVRFLEELGKEQFSDMQIKV